MSRGRAIPMLLALAILLLNAGDCISPLLADQKSKACCAKGQCHRPQKKDPCCQVTPPTTMKYFQASNRVTLDHAPVIAESADITRFVTPAITSLTVAGIDAAEWPPDRPQSVSLPLLV